MSSIRVKITALTLAAVLISIVSFGVIGFSFVMKESSNMSTQNLELICENRKDSIDEYLLSIQQAVSMISRYSIDALDSVALTEGGVLGADGSGVQEIPGRPDAQRQALDRYFDEHLSMIESAFASVANHVSGIASYYYRINPEITSVTKGFFYAKRGAADFLKTELTALHAYDRSDVGKVGWYFLPQQHGRPCWIDPYYSEIMEDWVVSYVVPVYKAGTFIGVIGMDIRFETIVEQVGEFANFETGYFVLTDENGRLFYHPDYAMGTDLREVLPQAHSAATTLHRDSSAGQSLRYEKNGTDWQMAFTTLVNGKKLGAVVKVSEINADSYHLRNLFLILGTLILLLFAAVTTITMRRVIKPLQKLTMAAQRLTAGDYEAELTCESHDEVGVLTDTFCAMRDQIKAQIAELSNSKAELQKALAASQQASLAKTTFLSNMSHEIRTPLNSIIGFTNLAEQQIDDRERVLNYIQKIGTSGKHLLSLINDVLDVSRIESGRVVLQDEVFSFRELLGQVNTIIAGQCANKGQHYETHIIGAVGQAYSGDEMKLKEVLINILGNAVKYTPAGGTIRFSVEQIAAFDDLCTLRFIVADNGIGMSKEFLPRLFDAFAQEDDKKASQFGSTGLGMAITKNIIQLMNGEIAVESEKGVGSTFTITVTLKDARQGVFTDDTGTSSGSGESREQESGEEAGGLAGLRVLIAEDMEMNAELMGDILDLEDVEHEWAENGQHALELFSGKPAGYFDAILMDIRMPIMDGLQATRAIRTLDRPDAKSIPIIAMSANAFAEDVQLSLQAGMNAHLSKPVDTDRLFEELRKIVAEKQQ